MNYSQATSATVSRAQAEKEIVKHGHSMSKFVRDCGDKMQYQGSEILNWLGY